MKIWLTTDTHFGHRKLEEWGRPPAFEQNIFTGLETTTKIGDIIIHLGDFCIGEDLLWHRRYFHLLPGRKHWLVLGNHDKKSVSWYLEHGWDWVGESMELKVFGKKILLTHKPAECPDNWFNSNINIFGHLHGNDHRKGENVIFKGYHYPLALEKTNYQPVSLRTFVGQ